MIYIHNPYPPERELIPPSFKTAHRVSQVTITFEVPEDSHIDTAAINTLLKGMGATDIEIDINE